ncbi:MAG: hypothetical protein AAF414_08920 [Pseudomonadota bacterium]
MTSAMQLSIVEDKSAPGDGYAILRLDGVDQSPDGTIAVTFERLSDQPAFLGVGGWQADPVSLATGSVVQRGDVLDIFVGPQITQHLVAGTKLALAVEALGFATELVWPDFVSEPLALDPQSAASRTPEHPPLSSGLSAPGDLRAGTRGGLRAAPRSEGGHRREPRLGAPKRPRRLSASKPPPTQRTRDVGATPSGLSASPQSEPAAPRLSARQSASAPPASDQASESAALPWEWTDPPPEAGDQPPPANSAAPKADRGGRARRTGARRMPLPWRIFSVNLVILLVLGAVGYAMVFNGWDPIRMFTGDAREQASAGRDGPSIQTLPRETAVDASAVARQRALDALAVAITGPVGEARAAIEEGADGPRIFELATVFQTEGDPGTALPLYEYAAIEGSSAAERAIGRMADPVYFGAGRTAFTRPNAELAIDRYRRAVALGNTEAAADLDALQAWLQQAASSGDQEAQNALLLFETTEL